MLVLMGSMFFLFLDSVTHGKRYIKLNPGKYEIPKSLIKHLGVRFQPGSAEVQTRISHEHFGPEALYWIFVL